MSQQKAPVIWKIFLIYLSINIERITCKGTINLKWDPMSVEDFSHFRIESKLFNDSVWTFIKDSANPMLTEFEDKIEDDEDLLQGRDNGCRYECALEKKV